MKFSTIASFLIAIILAGLAVYGARNWLNLERQQFADALLQQSRQEENAPENTIVVANETIGFGERLDTSRVREIEWSGAITPEGSFKKIEDLVIGESEETARYALTTITAGEPILVTKVTVPGQRAKLSTALTPGMKAISIRVNDVLGVAGFVLPGDRVDIMLTRNNYVDVLLQGIKVLAIDQIADDRKDKPSVVRTVTFEVNTLEAQKLVLAGNVGTLSLALRNLASTDIEDLERVTLTDLNDFDVADDLMKAKAEEEAKEDPSIERIENLEALLKNLSDGVTEQIQGVEEKINAREPAIVPLVPQKRTVGVIRNGQRSDYKVEQGQEGPEEEMTGDGAEPELSESTDGLINLEDS